METQFKESTQSLLRPSQVVNMTEERDRLKQTLGSNQPHIQNAIQDRGAMVKQLRSISDMLEKQAPKSYESNELDAAKKRETQLLNDILQGMPTQAEMRKNPAGAVDKHRQWEARNKKKILEWKNIRLRLHASGAIDGALPNSGDVANLERFRPSGGAMELNMDNCQIPGKDYFMNYIPQSVVFNDAELALLKDVEPELAAKLPTLSSDARKAIKDILNTDDSPTITTNGEANGTVQKRETLSLNKDKT